MNNNGLCYKSYDISSGYTDDGYEVPFKFSGDDLLVYLAVWNSSSSSLAPVALVKDVDYSITTPNVFQLRKVVLSSTGKRDGYDTLILYRNTSLKQLVDLIAGQAIDPDVIEAMVDRLYSIAQEIRRDMKLALRLPMGSQDTTDLTLPTAGERANKYPAFDSNGDLELVEAADNKTVIERFYSDELRLKALEDAMLSVDVGVDANSENLVFGQGM